MKKLSNAEAELKKSVAYIKKHVHERHIDKTTTVVTNNDNSRSLSVKYSKQTDSLR